MDEDYFSQTDFRWQRKWRISHFARAAQGVMVGRDPLKVWNWREIIDQTKIYFINLHWKERIKFKILNTLISIVQFVKVLTNNTFFFSFIKRPSPTCHVPELKQMQTSHQFFRDGVKFKITKIHPCNHQHPRGLKRFSLWQWGAGFTP